jgi:hypothetical protein
MMRSNRRFAERTGTTNRGETVFASARRLTTGVLCGLALYLVSARAQAEAPPASKEPLPVKDPVAFLEDCVKRFDQQHIQGYHLTLHKRERIGGTLHPVEDVDLFVRMQPRSIFMSWRNGARGADRALYVEGENEGKILVRPIGLAGYFVKTAALDPNGAAVRNSSRYSMKEVGLRHTLLRTLDAWRTGEASEVGKIEYLGVRAVRAAGGRDCYTLRRTTTEPENGVTETTVYIDKETRFQVGTVLKGPDDKLLGCYFYRDIELNPDFAPGQFEAGALLK